MAGTVFGAGAAARAALQGGSESDRMGGDWVPVLRDVPLFEGLSTRHLKRVAGLARTRRFHPGAAIIRAGDPGSAFYVILDGEVRVMPASGKPVLLSAGAAFGEMALLDDAPRSADVVAEGEVLTMTIGRAAFEKLLRREPALSLALLRTLAARLRTAQALSQ
jgi:CRP/FNR family transcriptional regulator, cyclic AMP receptor protein